MGISKQTKLTDYDGFVDKFVPKKTTDDCYTPQAVYDEVLRFVGELTDLTEREVVRPFWPGGDYERYDYPKGCIVVDNPPFSIYSQVVKFYLRHKIDFFLFAPALTQTINGAECCYIVLGVDVTYENGAVVPTSFTTNLCKASVWCCPELYNRLNAKNPPKATIATIHYNDNIVTPAMLQKITKSGVEFKIMPESCAYISKADNYEKSLFGRGWMLSTRAAAERAAAERAHIVPLSEREKKIVEWLDQQEARHSNPHIDPMRDSHIDPQRDSHIDPMRDSHIDPYPLWEAYKK